MVAASRPRAPVRRFPRPPYSSDPHARPGPTGRAGTVARYGGSGVDPGYPRYHGGGGGPARSSPSGPSRRAARGAAGYGTPAARCRSGPDRSRVVTRTIYYYY